MVQLSCAHLDLGYEGQMLVHDLSFAVEAGDYLCIIGENGSGKTTLMRTLLRLQKPLAGTIHMQSGAIGYLPQKTETQQDFPASVQEIVRSGCQNRMGMRPFYNRAEKQKADAMMEKMGILSLKNRCFRELSGGQQQRTLLARALCAADGLLLLDEPVSGLDPEATAELYALIRKLNQQGMTIIMISHDMQAVTEDASHVLKIGDPLFFGTKEDWLGGEPHA